MSYSNNIKVLIADNDAVSRQYIADMLSMNGYKVIQAIDGGSAMKVADDGDVDIAIIGHQMMPKSGLDFARHVLIKGYDIGMVMVTDDPSTDLLLEAGKHEIKQVMRKPVDSNRLLGIVKRVLRAHGKNPDSIAGGGDTAYTPKDLMDRAIALAHQNARSGMGGPFGAVLADAQGRILGEGVNSVKTRCDPTAHAEIIAIRRATEQQNSTDLSGCVVYCSSEPTMLGEALIIGTGIEKVVYGLSHEEVGITRLSEEGVAAQIAKPANERDVPHEQLQHDEALDMFTTWQEQKKK